MTPEEFIAQEEKSGRTTLLFTIKPFQSRATACLWREELAKLLKRYSDLVLKEREQKK